jgi:hypothetical protein
MGSLIEDVFFDKYEHEETDPKLVRDYFENEAGQWFLKRDRIDKVNFMTTGRPFKT